MKQAVSSEAIGSDEKSEAGQKKRTLNRGQVSDADRWPESKRAEVTLRYGEFSEADAELSGDELNQMLALRSMLASQGYADVPAVVLAQYTICNRVVDGRVVTGQQKLDVCSRRYRKIRGMWDDMDLGSVTEEELRKHTQGNPLYTSFGETERHLTFHVTTMRHWIPAEVQANLSVVFRSAHDFFDAMNATVLNMRRGTIMISDCEGVSMKNFNVALEKKRAAFWQDGYPQRVVDVTMVDSPWYMKAILATLKVFIRGRILDRIQTFSRDSAGLREKFGGGILPPQMGGAYLNHNGDPFTWIRERLRLRHETNQQLEERLNEYEAKLVQED